MTHGSSQIPYFKSDVDDTNRPVSAGWLQLQERVSTYLKVRQRRSAIVAEGERFLEAKRLCVKPDALVQIRDTDGDMRAPTFIVSPSTANS